ncbi:MAG: hypothetical protein GF388_03140 [Candidatus Aegiribacteria sp.]|nr:hypothetical protein [Candidatus Aegiribacteria sp.]MBD3294263.1 hypothetical protein [Candidatus Fermentibacteria bacterium]
MEKKRKFILIVAVVGMVGTFLPWASYFGGSVNGMDGSDGWINLVLFGIGGAVALFSGEKSEPIKKSMSMVIWIPAGLAALIALAKLFKSYPPGVEIGIGLWLIAIAGVLQVLLVMFFKGEGGWDMPKSVDDVKQAAKPDSPEEPAALEEEKPE